MEKSWVMMKDRTDKEHEELVLREKSATCTVRLCKYTLAVPGALSCTKHVARQRCLGQTHFKDGRPNPPGVNPLSLGPRPAYP